ncbi:ATP-dependent RecD-like DNA helicase [Myxococcota bacterium]|nr:ATP-dependent RecD-like DNA helicase [Myxococcota bacterium]
MSREQRPLFPSADRGPRDPAATGDGARTVVQGVVERVIHTHPDDGWTVARLEADDGRAITVVGFLAGSRAGEELRCEGRWVRDPRFGEQLRVESCVTVAPSTLTGIERYLSSGIVRGLGPKLAARLVQRFGLATLDVIEGQPERLAEVEGLGPKRIAELRGAWTTGREARQVMVFLQGHGVSPAYAGRIVKRYGAGALAVVRSNPYQLADEVAGIGFLTADRIALSLGLPEDAPARLRASLLHHLAETAEHGHTCFPADALLRRASDRIGVPREALEPSLRDLVTEGRVVEGPDPSQPGGRLVATAELDAAERAAAAVLARLLGAPPAPPPPPALLAWAQARLGLSLAPAQRDAVTLALSAPLAVVTGGPGTGKTTLLRALLAVSEGQGIDVVLAAPTGRAAKRMTEATSAPASTLHRLLDYSPADGGFRRGPRRPLETGLVVVDEASMLDQPLFTALVAALPIGARLVLVGDVDQLPSVGPGRVLADLIGSGAVPVARLEDVYRQREGSLITANAHRIRSGEPPTLPAGGGGGDFFMVAREDAGAVARTVVELVAERIPRHFGLDPRADIQVLVPMHRGVAGAVALNQALQEALNPPDPAKGEVRRGGRVYRAGDRVLQVRNDYDREVWNGDLGRVASVDPGAGEVRVAFDDHEATYEVGDLDAVQPAYAITVHKSQGSEYPAVVVPLLTEHAVMLRRNLLYTAVTRARRLVVLVGSRRALGLALREGEGDGRRTRLVERIQEAVAVGDAPETLRLPFRGVTPPRRGPR